MADWEDVARELVTERYNALVGYARVVAGSGVSAEDLVQEALLATFSRPRSLTSVAVAEAYVRRAIVTRFIDGIRRRRPQVSGNAEDLAAVAVQAGHAEAVESATDLYAALSLLAPRERACVVLRYLEGLSIKETAHVLGLAEGSVKRYVSDGIARLNGLLGTDAPTEDSVFVRVAGRGAK